MLKYIASAAAIALAATTLHADPGGGQGGGKGNAGGGGSGSAEQAKVGGKGNSDKGNSDKGNTGKGSGQAQRAAPQGSGDYNGKPKGRDARAEAPRGNPERQARGLDRVESKGNSDRNMRNADADVQRGKGRDESGSAINDRRALGTDDRQFDRQFDRQVDREPFRWASLDRRGVVQGCPPGLAKKNNGCLPPGQAKARYDHWRAGYDRPDWWGFDDYQGRYSYSDGRLLQLGSNGSILGYLPLLGGALAPGNLWPSYYEPVAVPDYYQSYYNLGSEDSYRYYDDAFYSVDPQTQAISAITALLTGDDFAVGQQLPQGYDVYNVPYSYRDDYVDGPDAAYRYSDGYIYEVDPTTQLIRTAIELLA